jgi:hypothetical protein
MICCAIPTDEGLELHGTKDELTFDGGPSDPPNHEDLGDGLDRSDDHRSHRLRHVGWMVFFVCVWMDRRMYVWATKGFASVYLCRRQQQSIVGFSVEKIEKMMMINDVVIHQL